MEKINKISTKWPCMSVNDKNHGNAFKNIYRLISVCKKHFFVIHRKTTFLLFLNLSFYLIQNTIGKLIFKQKQNQSIANNT